MLGQSKLFLLSSLHEMRGGQFTLVYLPIALTEALTNTLLKYFILNTLYKTMI